jgi:hypothetical protein
VVGEVRGRFGHAAAGAGRTDAPALAASHRQGGPSMAPSCRAADGNAKGSQGCRTRLSRDAIRKPWRQPVQRALVKPQQTMPQRRYSRNSASTCVGTGRSPRLRAVSQLSRCRLMNR